MSSMIDWNFLKILTSLIEIAIRNKSKNIKIYMQMPNIIDKFSF